MPETINGIIDAGVGSTIRIAKKNDKRIGTLIHYRFRTGMNSLYLHIEFEDGNIETFWHPKDVKLIKKSTFQCAGYFGGWSVLRTPYTPESLIGEISYRNQLSDDMLEIKKIGYQFCIQFSDSKKLYEGPFTLFRIAYEKLLEKSNVS